MGSFKNGNSPKREQPPADIVRSGSSLMRFNDGSLANTFAPALLSPRRLLQMGFIGVRYSIGCANISFSSMAF